MLNTKNLGAKLFQVIIRFRVFILVMIGLSTAFMAYKATKVEMSYEMAKMLPTTDVNSLNYDEFKKIFGQDGSVIFVGIQDTSLFELEKFNKLFDVTQKVKQMQGIQQVMSMTNLYNLTKNDSLKKFEFRPIINVKPTTQAQVDSVRDVIFGLKFYDNLLYNKKTHTYLVGITLDQKTINDKGRVETVAEIKAIFDAYGADNNLELHYSGLPYIRTVMSNMIKSELTLFIIISFFVALGIVILFFRSFYVMLTSTIVVLVSVVWSFGIIAMFDYKISILIGVLPSLLIIIAIENCIYLVNKYHWECRIHGDKMKALSVVVSRIGFATFMTNVTTATGFAAFIFTTNRMLFEFGVVSSIIIVVEFIFSLLLMVIIFSYLPEVKPAQLQHLDRRSTSYVLDIVKNMVANHRKKIYIISGFIIAFCIYGITMMKSSGKLVDDIPEENPIYIDLKFFESNFGGVMPFEVVIDTHKKNGVFADGARPLYKIKALQRLVKNDSILSQYFSRPLSITEGISFVYQAYRNGAPKYYLLPPVSELTKIKDYLGVNDSTTQTKNQLKAFIDSTGQRTRVSFQVADMRTEDMNKLMAHFQPQLDSLFSDTDYKVTVTGSSVVFTKGTEFLTNNLYESIGIGVLLISILMAIIFYSWRMIVIAMLVNIIPLLITAAIMGFSSIPIKPSTIIVFSIALAIAIDNAILFLSRYRQDLKHKNHSIFDAVMSAIDEAGISMIYTSIVLILGFAIFMISDFGGTQALGLLISITLTVALFFNMIVLPSLILSFEKTVTTHDFEEPLIDIYNDEEDVENEEKLLEK